MKKMLIVTALIFTFVLTGCGETQKSKEQRISFMKENYANISDEKMEVDFSVQFSLENLEGNILTTKSVRLEHYSHLDYYLIEESVMKCDKTKINDSNYVQSSKNLTRKIYINQNIFYYDYYEYDSLNNVLNSSVDSMESGYEEKKKEFVKEFSGKYKELYENYLSFDKAISYFEDFKPKDGEEFEFGECSFTDGNKPTINGNSIGYTKMGDYSIKLCCYKDSIIDFNYKSLDIDNVKYDLFVSYSRVAKTEAEVKELLGIN